MATSVNNSPESEPANAVTDWNDLIGDLLEPCPQCSSPIDMTGVVPVSDVSCPSCGHQFKARARFNNFQVTDLLGQGGMGAVYRATDVNLQREVALKALKVDVSSDSKECEKLEIEARTTAAINHPHVVKVYDFGQAHGQFYIAMEMIAGGSLDDLIQEQSAVSEVVTLEVGIQIALGLEAALERGLIHRDLKPANILFTEPGSAKLVDFGLAMVMSEAAVSNGEIWGTPYYIAPEKLDEKPEDFRSDIYSLGGTLFHALAGRPPYEDKTASLVALKQLKSRPVSIQSFAPHVSNETAYVINRMMAKDPEKRYNSYAELLEHLRYALEKAREREASPNARKERPVLVDRSSAGWIPLVIPLILIFALIVLGYLYFFTQIFVEDF